MAVLSDDELDSAAEALEGWERVDGALRRSVTFPSFVDGINAVRRVADLAERADHHPDIDIRWRTVIFALSTHSEGGITQKDVDLATQIDRLLAVPS
jgi:4a-hydroxytetrahydrobiopterin dehydratase